MCVFSCSAAPLSYQSGLPCMPSCKGSCPPRGQTSISCIGKQILYHWVTWEAHPYKMTNQGVCTGIYPTCVEHPFGDWKEEQVSLALVHIASFNPHCWFKRKESPGSFHHKELNVRKQSPTFSNQVRNKIGKGQIPSPVPSTSLLNKSCHEFSSFLLRALTVFQHSTSAQVWSMGICLSALLLSVTPTQSLVIFILLPYRSVSIP